MSLTETVNEQLDVLLEVSVAVQVTVVTPFGKVEPEDGLHAAVAPGQLSVGVGVLKVTTAEHRLGSVDLVMFAGQVIEGGCVSLTVTVNEHEPGLPLPSETEQVTVVVPFGNAEPLAGEQVTEPIFGQLSLGVGVV